MREETWGNGICWSTSKNTARGSYFVARLGRSVLYSSGGISIWNVSLISILAGTKYQFKYFAEYHMIISGVTPSLRGRSASRFARPTAVEGCKEQLIETTVRKGSAPKLSASVSCRSRPVVRRDSERSPSQKRTQSVGRVLFWVVCMYDLCGPTTRWSLRSNRRWNCRHWHLIGSGRKARGLATFPSFEI